MSIPDREPDIQLTLPLPPSANKSWRPGRAATGAPAMFKRDAFKAWLDAAAWQVAAQRAGDSIPRHYEMRVIVPVTRQDPDNCLKALSDSCQRGGAIANDKHLRRLVLEVDPARKLQSALIHLWAR